MPHSWETEDNSDSSDGAPFDVEQISISALKFFAWLDLIAGIILSIIIWAKYSTDKITTTGAYSITETFVNPIAIGIGIAVLFQGLFVWALFLVLSSIAQNLIAIKENAKVKESK